jgi:hypothetical protein
VFGSPLGEYGRIVLHPFEAPERNGNATGRFELQTRLVITAQNPATQEVLFREVDGLMEYRFSRSISSIGRHRREALKAVSLPKHYED